MRVLGITGSLRRDSLNHALLREAAERLPAGVELVEFERLAEIPPYDADLETKEAPEAVAELRQAMREADAVLVATPEYNHSIPGVLKNALDWASRPAGQSALMGKPAAVIGASTGMFGAVWAQAETRKVLGALGGRVVEAELPVARAGELYRDGNLELSPEQSRQLEEILATLAAEVEQLRELVAA
jgi:chromate reductase